MMRKLGQYIGLIGLLLVCGLGLPACDTQKERIVCDYTVQLRYDYNEENSTDENRIEYWVFTIDEYLFDEAGILYLHRQVTPDRCSEYLNSEHDLPPGRYSVIAIGNLEEQSVISDVSTGSAPVAGQTRRENMRMNLLNAETYDNGLKGPCEELFYAYRSFTVKPSGISRVRVDMMNAHFQLRFRMTWKHNGTPVRGNYYATLEDIPSEYALMPEWFYPTASLDCQLFDSDRDDTWPSNSNDVIHHIPHTCYNGNNVLSHRNNTYINADNEMWGQFVNYRIKNSTIPLLRIYDADDTQIVKTIDLQAYFAWYGYELDHELKQEYELDIEVDPVNNTVTIHPLNVADWDEGEELRYY